MDVAGVLSLPLLSTPVFVPATVFLVLGGRGPCRPYSQLRLAKSEVKLFIALSFSFSGIQLPTPRKKSLVPRVVSSIAGPIF